MEIDQRLNGFPISGFPIWGRRVPDFDTADSSGGTEIGNPVPVLYYSLSTSLNYVRTSISAMNERPNNFVFQSLISGFRDELIIVHPRATQNAFVLRPTRCREAARRASRSRLTVPVARR